MQERAPSAASPSVIVSWARTISAALLAHGIEPHHVLSQVGLSVDALNDPNARMPVQAMRALWKEAARQVGDPAFGLRISKHLRHSSFHALGYAVLASSSLREALARMVEYNRLVSDAGQLSVEVAGELCHLRITLHDGYEGGNEEAMDAMVSAIVRTCRALHERSFALHEVALRRAAPPDLAPYQRFFGCPLRFGEENRISFAASLLDEPLATGNPTLARHNDDAARAYLARAESSNVVDRVRSAMFEDSGLRTSAKQVSRKLGMSLRSMQRSLAAHGTSYEEVLTALRHKLACAYLREACHSVTEIARMLGYERESAFARAFKRWTGLAPSEYARSQRGG